MNHNPIDRKHLLLRHKVYLYNVSKAIVNLVNHPPKSTSNHQKKVLGTINPYGWLMTLLMNIAVYDVPIVDIPLNHHNRSPGRGRESIPITITWRNPPAPARVSAREDFGGIVKCYSRPGDQEKTGSSKKKKGSFLWIVYSDLIVI